MGGYKWVATNGWLQMGGYKLSERFYELVTKELALKPHIKRSVRFHDSIDLGIKKIELSLFLAASAYLVEAAHPSSRGQDQGLLMRRRYSESLA